MAQLNRAWKHHYGPFPLSNQFATYGECVDRLGLAIERSGGGDAAGASVNAELIFRDAQRQIVRQFPVDPLVSVRGFHLGKGGDVRGAILACIQYNSRGSKDLGNNTVKEKTIFSLHKP